jgi:hypothetical protein
VKLRSKILLVLVLLLVLGFIFLLPHGGYRHALEAYKQQLLARGEKLTIAELAPQPSINPSNGAKAFMQLMSNYTSPNDYPYTMRMLAPGLAATDCTNETPEMTANYEQNASKTAELHNVLNMPTLDFDLDYSRGVFILLPHLAKLKSAEHLACITTMQAFHAKNLPEAKSDLLTAVQLVRLFRNDSLEMSDLVRCTMAYIAQAATWEGLQSDKWSEAELAELQSKWDEMDFFRDSESVLMMERANELALFDWGRQSYDGTGSFSGFSSAPTSGTSLTGGGFNSGFGQKLKGLYDRYPRYWMWKSSWSYDEEFCYLQILNNGLESCRLTKTTGAFVPALNKLRQEDTSIAQRHPEATNHFWIFFPSSDWFDTYLLRLAKCETARRLTVTAIALKRYHLQHGAYPATLNELVPAFLPAVPGDFMDGKPLRYRLRPDGDFLLYSVGEDGIDDGGDPTPASSTTSLNWLLGRDIVWPRVATPAALEEYHRLSQSATNSPAK